MTTTQAVYAIVDEVLDRTVGPEEDLYDLGFDSLLIARTAARVRERLGIDLPLAEYFNAGTVAELAAAVSQHALGAAAEPAAAVGERPA